MRGIMYSTGFKRRKNLNMLIFYFVGMVLVILSGHPELESKLAAVRDYRLRYGID